MMASSGDTLPIPTSATDKVALRRAARLRRAAIPKCQRQRAAVRAARALLPALPPRARIAVYLSIASELSTKPLIEALRRAGHRVYVPLTLQDWKMRFVPLRGATPLRHRGAFQLLEPCVTRPRLNASELDVIVLPLLAFDGRGTRLGNGGGYYDRALAGPRIGRRPRLIGHAYAAQEISGLPRERWDVALDAVVTERGLRVFR